MSSHPKLKSPMSHENEKCYANTHRMVNANTLVEFPENFKKNICNYELINWAHLNLETTNLQYT